MTAPASGRVVGSFDPKNIGFNTACFAGMGVYEAMEAGLEAGFKACELLAFDGYRHSQGRLGGFYFEHMTAEERDRLRETTSSFEHIAIHAPFIDIATFAPNPSVRKTAQKQLEIGIGATAFLGGAVTTTHISAKTGYRFGEYEDEIVELYRRLGDLAAEAGVVVTCETGYPQDIDEFAGIIEAIDHPKVGATVDVGHLVGAIPGELRGTEEGIHLYQDMLEEHILSLGSKVYHVHTHDIRREDFRDHRGIGRGFLDYGRVLRALREIEYKGLLALELEEPDAAEAVRESKRYLEDVMGELAEGEA